MLWGRNHDIGSPKSQQMKILSAFCCQSNHIGQALGFAAFLLCNCAVATEALSLPGSPFPLLENWNNNSTHLRGLLPKLY